MLYSTVLAFLAISMGLVAAVPSPVGYVPPTTYEYKGVFLTAPKLLQVLLLII